MARFVYVAKRSLISGHLVDNQYLLDIDLQEEESADEDVKTSEQAIGGGQETVYHRTDVVHTLRFAPVSGAALLALREFLDSTVTGESFKVYLYGDETEGLKLRRLEEQHAEDVFIRRGGEDRDAFEATINAIETTDEVILIDPYVPDPEADETLLIDVIPNSLLAFSMNGTGERTGTYAPADLGTEEGEFLCIAVALQSLPAADLASFAATYGGVAMDVEVYADPAFSPRRPVFICTLANPADGSGTDFVFDATNIGSTAARVVALTLYNVSPPVSPPGEAIEALDESGELVGGELSVVAGGAVVVFGLAFTGGDANPLIESETDDAGYTEAVGAPISGTGIDLVLGYRLFEDATDEAARIVDPNSTDPYLVEEGAIGIAFTLEPIS